VALGVRQLSECCVDLFQDNLDYCVVHGRDRGDVGFVRSIKPRPDLGHLGLRRQRCAVLLAIRLERVAIRQVGAATFGPAALRPGAGPPGDLGADGGVCRDQPFGGVLFGSDRVLIAQPRGAKVERPAGDFLG